MDFRKSKTAALILVVGNLFHFAAIISFYLRFFLIINDPQFFTLFFYFLLIDLLANIAFFFLIIPLIEKNREEVLVLSITFTFTTLMSRLIVSGAVITFFGGNFNAYIPSLLNSVMEILITKLNLVALSSIFYALLLLILSRNELFKSKESIIQAIASINLVISLLMVPPISAASTLFIISSFLFILKATVFPILMIITMSLWYFDLRNLELQENLKTTQEATDLVDDELFKKQEDLQAQLYYAEFVTDTADILLEKIPTSAKLQKIAEILELVNVTGIIIYEYHPLNIYTIKHYGTNADYNYSQLEEIGFQITNYTDLLEDRIISHRDEPHPSLLDGDKINQVHSKGINSIMIFPLHNGKECVAFTNINQYIWNTDEINFIEKVVHLLEKID